MTDSIDAYDLASYSREHSKWLGALMRTIQIDAQHNGGRNAATLANLGQYLADDLHGYMDSEAERIKKAEGLQ